MHLEQKNLVCARVMIDTESLQFWACRKAAPKPGRGISTIGGKAAIRPGFWARPKTANSPIQSTGASAAGPVCRHGMAKMKTVFLPFHKGSPAPSGILHFPPLPSHPTIRHKPNQNKPPTPIITTHHSSPQQQRWTTRSRGFLWSISSQPPSTRKCPSILHSSPQTSRFRTSNS
jgi:hypothetical protein